MDESYKYTTPEQQIKKLKSQNLSFKNEHIAKKILETYGYYNIINGYRDPYITRSYGEKKYTANVTFEQIYALFKLDHNIRSAVLLSMIDLEEHLRAVVSDIIAEAFGTNHKDYLQKNNYRDKKVRDPYYSRENILESLTRVAENSHKEPIQYYRRKYGFVPPWILFKGAYFGTLINFIRLLKKPQRDKLVYALYGNKQVTQENIDSFKDLLSDTLFLCRDYRNLAAHGGRVYNYIPQKNIRFFEKDKQLSGLLQLVSGLDFFLYKKPCKDIEKAINESLNEYCHTYPNDIPRLEQAIGLEIIAKNFVWINLNTGKYHTNPHCSGSQLCKEVLLDYAEQKGYEPCKKCCNSIISTNDSINT